MSESTLLAAQEAAKEKNWEKSLELYNQAVEANPTAEAFLGRAQVHNKLKSYVEAAADASRAAELDDKLAAAHKEKGHACYNLEEFESALDAFEAAAALEPGKKAHQTWADMCRVQLGETLPPPPMTSTPTQVAQAPTMPSPPRSSAAGDRGQGLTLQGDALKAFLAQTRAGGLPPPTAPEEPGSERPAAVRIDDPEFSKYWRAPIAGSIVASLPDASSGAKYRHQWFQTAERLEVNVLAKGLKKEQVTVTFEPQRLHVVTRDQQGQQDYELDVALHGQVLPAECHYEVLGTKVEVKLRKAAAGPWPALEQQQDTAAPAPTADTVQAEAAQGEAAPAGDAQAGGTAPAGSPSKPTPLYPYAGKKVDWDKLAKDVQAEEKEEKLEGDQALMKFFRELYEGGDEDTRRAMVKSMQESGGTALSMNWGEVGKNDYAKRGKEEDANEGEDWASR